MDHEVTVIHEHPFPFRHSFLAQGLTPNFSQHLGNPLCNGLDLTVRLPAADEEVVRVGTDSSHFEEDQFRRLLFNRSPDA
jgi:hypothetical protein